LSNNYPLDNPTLSFLAVQALQSLINAQDSVIPENDITKFSERFFGRITEGLLQVIIS